MKPIILLTLIGNCLYQSSS